MRLAGTRSQAKWQHRRKKMASFRVRKLLSNALAMSQPEDVDINEILFRPTPQELSDCLSVRN
jgi:hypothetical protein